MVLFLLIILHFTMSAVTSTMDDGSLRQFVMVPPPDRLVRHPRPDPCRVLCTEFTASRRGDGDDLCHTLIQSTCIYSFYPIEGHCDHIYWSQTEDGLPGLVYSISGTDLTNEERDHSVSCQEAEQIVDDYYVPPLETPLVVDDDNDDDDNSSPIEYQFDNFGDLAFLTR